MKFRRILCVQKLRILCGAAFVVLAVICALSFSDRPLLTNASSGSRAIFDRHDTLLALTLSSDERYRLWVPLQEIAPSMIEATLTYEDQWYFSHFGINPWALLRGFVTTYITGQRRTGGSTITMQVARMRYGIDSRTVVGKLQQLWYAFVLEWKFSKSEILEAYLNSAPYGQNIEGVGAASLIYFGIPPAKLSLEQSVLLAVVPQNPTRRSPARKPALDPAVHQARSSLAARLIQDHPELFAHLNVDLPLEISQRKDLPQYAPHAVRALLAQNDPNPIIKTGLDLHLQNLADELLSNFLERYRDAGIRNGSVLIADWRTMEARAYVGSADFFNPAIAGQVDGTRARRSPGSALKPFLYAVAMEQGLIHPLSLLKDTPKSFAAYDPENFDRSFIGPIAARDALVRSRNVPAVDLVNQINGNAFYQLLRNAGIGKLRSPEFYGLALALGGVEVTLQELVSLYGMLARRGELLPLKINQHDTSPVKQLRLLSPETAYLTLEMLSHNPRPDAPFAAGDETTKNAVAWKTGTSFGFRDAWAIGVINQFVVGVWLGNFDGAGNPAFIGRDSAGRLLFRITDALQRVAPVEINPLGRTGLNVSEVAVCADSGAIPTAACPHTRKGWFIPGVSPIAPCTIHREVLIDDSTGLRACNERSGTHQHVYEFWPSDLLELFRSAGVPRRTPPAFEPHCAQEAGVAPQIVSPERGLVYQVRLDAVSSEEDLPLRAVVDADVQTLFWFVNEMFIGKSAPDQPLMWRLRPGNFVARVVDERGRGMSRSFSVTAIK